MVVEIMCLMSLMVVSKIKEKLCLVRDCGVITLRETLAHERD